MKKIFSFAKRKRGFSPNSSDTGSVLSLGYEIKEKDLSKIHKAASAGDLAKLKQLSKKSDLNLLDKENRTPLHIACANGHAEVVQFLLESKAKLNLCDNQNRSPLMKAVQCQQESCVALLLDHNSDPNLGDINGETALHLAALIPSLSLTEVLLEHGAHVNAQNKDGCTPLTLAVTGNHAEMAELLLKEGADVNSKDQAGRTCLMIAAGNGQISMVRLLLRFDADTTQKDGNMWSPDDYAIKNGHHACSHLITEHGTKRMSHPSPPHLAQDPTRPASFSGPVTGLTLGEPAVDKEVDEDNSQVESISRALKGDASDSWPSTDDDDSPKKQQKPNLKKLLTASQKGRKPALSDCDCASEPASEDCSEANPTLPVAFPPTANFLYPASPTPTSCSKRQMTPPPLHRSVKEDKQEEELQLLPTEREHVKCLKLKPGTLKDKYATEEKEEEGNDDGETSEENGEEEDGGATEDSWHGNVVQKSDASSKDVKRDFLSELGLEGGINDGQEESSWDSESASDSPRRQQGGLNKCPVKADKVMTSISEENHGASGNGNMDEVLRTHRGSELPPPAVPKETSDRNTDLMGDLGLVDADDLEASDWDSSSAASRNLPLPRKALALREEHSVNTAVSVLPAAEREQPPPTAERNPSASQARPVPSPRSLSSQPRAGRQQPVTADRDQDSDWDSGSVTSASSFSKARKHKPSPAKRKTVPEQGVLSQVPESKGNSEPQVDLTQEKDVLKASELYVSKPNQLGGVETNACGVLGEVGDEDGGEDAEEGPDEDESEAGEKDQDCPWVEPEEMWMETEKRVVRSNYRGVTAELKERFRELALKQANHSGSEATGQEEKVPEAGTMEEESTAARIQSLDLVPISEQGGSGMVSLSEPAKTLQLEAGTWTHKQAPTEKMELNHPGDCTVRSSSPTPSAEISEKMELNHPGDCTVRSSSPTPSAEISEKMELNHPGDCTVRSSSPTPSAEISEKMELNHPGDCTVRSSSPTPSAEISEKMELNHPGDCTVRSSSPTPSAEISEKMELNHPGDCTVRSSSPTPSAEISEKMELNHPVDCTVRSSSPTPSAEISEKMDLNHPGDCTVRSSSPTPSAEISKKMELNHPGDCTVRSSSPTPSAEISEKMELNHPGDCTVRSSMKRHENGLPYPEQPTEGNVQDSTDLQSKMENCEGGIYKAINVGSSVINENIYLNMSKETQFSVARLRSCKGTGEDMKTPKFLENDPRQTPVPSPRTRHSPAVTLTLGQDMQGFEHGVGPLKASVFDLEKEKMCLQRQVNGENEKEQVEVRDRNHLMDVGRKSRQISPHKEPKCVKSQHKRGSVNRVTQGCKTRDGVTQRGSSKNPNRSVPRGNPKTNGASETETADELEEPTQSSDTTTEEAAIPMSGYHSASLLIKPLDSSPRGSLSTTRLQNVLHKYERTIQRERGHYCRLAGEVSLLEEDQSQLRQVLQETRDSRSALERQKVELEADLDNLRFTLKQEQERHRSTTALYDKCHEQLRKVEEQHLSEVEERQKVERTVRNLELEMRAQVNSMKQLEEDRSEAQRILAQERNARILQEGILNNHLCKQKEIDEQNRRNLDTNNEAMAQVAGARIREKELLQQNRTLQEEVTKLKLDLEQARIHSHPDEESQVLRERLEDSKQDLKLNQEALAHTVYQYSGQLAALRTECSVAAVRLERERQTRLKLEAEAESARGQLGAALQELERERAALAEVERARQRERDDWQRSQDRLTSELTEQRQAAHGLSQHLSTAETRANTLEGECHRATLSLTEKTLLLETAQRERDQARARLGELEADLRTERERAGMAGARLEAVQERLVQAQGEVTLLRQQVEQACSRGVAQDRVATDVQERFGDILAKLRADGEERVSMAEERTKELVAKNFEQQEQLNRQEREKAEREAALRQLQQELADALKKLAMSEASLEVGSRYRCDLEEEKQRLLKDVDRLKAKLQESQDQHVQSERLIHELRVALGDRERDLLASSQKLQEVQCSSMATENTVKQLEETVQRLEVENAGLEFTAKQQTGRMEVLQKRVEESVRMRTHLEDLVSNLQGSKIDLEDQLNKEVQKQSVLTHSTKDSHQLWEEELKARSRLGLRLAEMEREKGELSSQMEMEKKKAKKFSEQKKSLDVRLDQEIKRNTELQKEMYRLRGLLKTAKKQLRGQETMEGVVQLASLRGQMVPRQLETEATVDRMKSKVDELSVRLEREELKCRKLEVQNRELKEKLVSARSMSRSHERLEEEVSALRRQVETRMVDQSLVDQYRRETEEKARQEVRKKLEEVNLFLQTQATSQEALEQIKAANEASLRTQLEQRLGDLEGELARVRSSQQDSLSQRDSARAELERYRELYTEELRLRKALAAKLERSNERLSEANSRLMSERHRSKSLIASSIANGSLGGPSLELGPVCRDLGGGFLCRVGNAQDSTVETYLTKMQNELEKNITKELDHELEGGTSCMSPSGSLAGSQRSRHADLDPMTRATQQYLEVLKKNYMV